MGAAYPHKGNLKRYYLYQDKEPPKGDDNFDNVFVHFLSKFFIEYKSNWKVSILEFFSLFKTEIFFTQSYIECSTFAARMDACDAQLFPSLVENVIKLFCVLEALEKIS
jgi:hypothetical protein